MRLISFPIRENHEALWNWLANNPEKEKEDWPGFETIERIFDIDIYTRCFLCYDQIQIKKRGSCDKCILQKQCLGPDIDQPGWFRKWDENPDLKERKKYALLIRDIYKNKGKE